MKKVAFLLPLFLSACMTSPYGADHQRGPYGDRDAAPYPAPYPDPYGNAQAGMNEPYRAIGTEPFWSLEIDRQEMRFETADGFRIREARPPVRPDRYGDVFEGQRLVVMIDRRRCSDGMSDRTYPDTVQVYQGDRQWRGCGAPESFFRNVPESGYPTDPYAPVGDLRLERTNWTVTSINGRNVPDSGYFINFLPGEMQARFGCNRMSATTELRGNMLTAGPIQSTRMACPDMSFESAASNILGSAAQVSIERDRLVIRNREGNIVAKRAR